jgi:hypothetical protein
LADTLPGYHLLASDVRAGDRAVLGGYGNTAGNAVAGGYDWNGAQAETWGANTIDNAGSLIVIDFDNPGASDAVPHEALFAVHDSGAGLFVYADDGSLELAGTAISVTGWNQTVYGNLAYCINLDYLRNWIEPIVAPGRPITSSTIAPRASLLGGGAGSIIWGGAVGVRIVLRRRRPGPR